LEKKPKKKKKKTSGSGMNTFHKNVQDGGSFKSAK